ncbi:MULTISPECIES: DUF3261 domain-containing protein [unclassified Janthinobacterium]|uniref:DUF3261 domain-containing protein n=1 Tax=unclassified Janthinobacterium TaxID=2610881 RepID=UPI001613AD65|nr:MULTISPECIES: DUF3261 domain-containing protein [unclassified Janthinobacterium]MBB5607750.1 hypothetical protein [Janthinobacterium sp. S3T4]MBB5613101.1 hypothetical protein [Janthinobacterium sp. S3M3]
MFLHCQRWAPALLLVLAGCASAPPSTPARLGLKLAPSALGASVSVQQHLRVERGGRIDELDAALEVEPSHLDLVGLAFGQRVLSLHYDGKEMTSWRHLMLPAQVRADDVLEDMQLTLWPRAAIAQALPAGWHIEDEGLRRTLSLNGEVVTVIAYSSMPRWSGTVVLDNLRYHYRLTIQNAPDGA